MNKVATINLNGRAFQIEESGFELLREYLEKAKIALEHNPDKDEIAKDLEQSIADKCSTYLTSHKNIVLSTEIKDIIEKMGPVHDTSGTEQASQSAQKEAPLATNPKKFYRIKEGAMILGICNGIALYFNVDVTIVRLITVAITIGTGGGLVFAYLIAGFLVQSANTPEDRAAAFNIPQTAQELVNRAQDQYKKFQGNHEQKQAWKLKRKEMKEQIKYNRQKWKYETYVNQPYQHNSWIGIVRSIVDTILALIWLAVIIAFFWFAHEHNAELHTAIDGIYNATKTFIDWIHNSF